ncbi:MAG: helix-turn-helix transcriptional regulator [Gammaproteobacteria bacterium]
MAHILISSADPNLAEQWKAVLLPDHEISLIDGLHNIDERVSCSPPAILVIDGDLLDGGIASLIERLPPRLKILIIGNHWSDQQQIDALLSGCAGYCETEIAKKLLLKAVDHLLKGDIWIQRHLVPRVIKALTVLNHNLQTQHSQHNQDFDKKLALLSNRELEVANLVKAGENNKKIASQLNISERTVKAHLTSIFSKLDIHDRLHLALFLKETSGSE